MDDHDPVRISAWLDGELDDETARKVAAHVERCAPCRELSDSIGALSRSFSRHTEPDPGFIVRFRERREQQSIAPWWTWRQFTLRLVPVALALLVAAAATVWVSAPDDPDLVGMELEALGNPVGFEPSTVGPPEAVLSIALESFPGEPR